MYVGAGVRKAHVVAIELPRAEELWWWWTRGIVLDNGGTLLVPSAPRHLLREVLDLRLKQVGDELEHDLEACDTHTMPCFCPKGNAKIFIVEQCEIGNIYFLTGLPSCKNSMCQI